jgi:hypothetical protein
MVAGRAARHHDHLVGAAVPEDAEVVEIDRIRYCAELSVKRGCGFAALGIGTVMVGLSGTPLVAFKAGALLATLLAVALAVKASVASRVSYRRTELWILLDRRHGLPEQAAQRVLSDILQDAYLRYMELAAVAALVLWVIGFVMAML